MLILKEEGLRKCSWVWVFLVVLFCFKLEESSILSFHCKETVSDNKLLHLSLVKLGRKEGKNSQCRELFLSNSLPWDTRGFLLQQMNNYQYLAAR